MSNRTTLVTLYQAGEQIYEVMDKVLVIDQGRCIYQGPAGEAKQYFIDLGFHCPERQTTADFLTAVTDPTERQFRQGFEDRAPKTAEELEEAFRKSEAYQRLLREIDQYEADLKRSEYSDAKEFEGAVRESKSKTVRKKSPYTVSFIRQVLACTQREFWLTWGDKTTLYTKFFIILSNGLIVGSLFYGQALDTSGAFVRPRCGQEARGLCLLPTKCCRHCPGCPGSSAAAGTGHPILDHYVFFDRFGCRRQQVLYLLPLHLHNDVLCYYDVSDVCRTLTNDRRCRSVCWHRTQPSHYLHWLRYSETTIAFRLYLVRMDILDQPVCILVEELRWTIC